MSSVELNELVEAAAAVAATPVGELSDAELSEQMLAARRLADAAEAAYLARLREFDTRDVAAADGLSTRSWLRHHARLAPGEATRSVRTAHAIAELPAAGAALARGDIRLAHATAMTDAARLLGSDVIAEAEQALVAAALECDPSRLRSALRGYGAAVDNPAAMAAARHRDEDSWLEIASTFDGAVHLQGVLSPELGGMVKSAVDAASAPGSAGDPRSAAERRADGLAEVCRRQLGTGGLPARQQQAPHLMVVCDLATLEARAGGYGELPDGATLTGETVRRLACDARLTRVITGPDSQPLDVGRTRRTATAAQRIALRIRDNGCRFPGCDRPADWTDAHHVIHWAHGGPTDVDAMILLCRRHHTAIHEGGWRIRLLGPGRFLFVDPRGRAMFDPAAGSTRSLVARIIDHTTPHAAQAGTHAAEAHATTRDAAHATTHTTIETNTGVSTRDGPSPPHHHAA